MSKQILNSADTPEPPAVRRGYDDRVGAGRARPKNIFSDLDQEPSMMVQEQIARLKWFAGCYDLTGRSILDLGCGTGFNCGYVLDKYGAKVAMGLDIAESALDFARKTYRGARYELSDICASNLYVGQHQIILCCEVIEHVLNPESLLENIRRHLAPDGVALITTPNKPVFSLGYEPSPVNHTHLKEYTLDEFQAMIARYFSNIAIAGQRFKNERLFRMQQEVVHRNIRDFERLGSLYWNISLRRLWKIARLEPLRRFFGGGLRYGHKDFEFMDPVSADSIWLCAVVRP